MEIDTGSFEKAKAQALKYLSYQSRTSKELRNKLEACGEFSEDVLDETIKILTEYGLINDMDYAKSYIVQKMNSRINPTGFYKLKQNLKLKGIDGTIFYSAYNAALEDNSISEEVQVEKAASLIQRKLNGTALDKKTQSKLYDYLARKGFEGSIIRKAFSALGCPLGIDE